MSNDLYMLIGALIVVLIALVAVAVYSIKKKKKQHSDHISSRTVIVKRDVHASASVNNRSTKYDTDEISDDVGMINVALGAIAISELMDTSNDGHTEETKNLSSDSTSSWDSDSSSDWD